MTKGVKGSDLFRTFEPLVEFIIDGLDQVPAVDVADEGDHYTVDIAVPGYNPKHDVELRIENNCLFIKGHRATDEKNSKRNFKVREIKHNAFNRHVRFSEEIDPVNVKAVYDNDTGLIRCKVPKKTTSAKRIKIQ